MEMSPAFQSFLVLILGLMIFATVVGNILVCLSVILVRKLRHPSNYLLISLAVSDLCVGILVMPLALYYELKGTWPFGPRICDLWISFDVTCCTASILNLCMISVDRYLAITKPLTYTVRRKSKRFLVWILSVWLGSCLISIPPLVIFGNDYGTESDPRCNYSQSILYQLYATLGAFYIPLIVMITVYYKIYVAAKRVVEAEMKSQMSFGSPAAIVIGGNTNTGTATCTESNTTTTALSRLLSSKQDSRQNLSPFSSFNKSEMITVDEVRGKSTRFSDQDEDDKKDEDDYENEKPGADVGRETDSSELVMELIKDRRSNLQQKNGLQNSGRENGGKARTGNNKSLVYPSCGEKPKPLASHCSQPVLDSKMGNKSVSSSPKKMMTKRKKNPWKKPYGSKSSVWKERKASITLGVIMTAFIACWLPFFILALLRPIPVIGDIPRWATSSTLWLGFTNSMLNPIIYVKFHQDFRQAFRYLLCFQCRTMNTRIREEAYYGANS